MTVARYPHLTTSRFLLPAVLSHRLVGPISWRLVLLVSTPWLFMGCAETKCPDHLMKAEQGCAAPDGGTGSLDAGNSGADACTGAPFLDQSLGSCGTASPRCTTASLLPSGQQAAQGFQPSQSGRLDHVRLRISNSAPATHQVVVQLLNLGTDAEALADPHYDWGQGLLASVSLPLTTAMDWQTIRFKPAPMVSKDRHYAILALINGPADSAKAEWELHVDSAEQRDLYAKGFAFTCGPGCAVVKRSPIHHDHAFEVHITPESCP